jgi:cbb3-type cytochrome oxidase cytochrome c subunit
MIMPSYEWIKQREEILKLEDELKIMKINVKDLQQQLQAAYKRIGELVNKRSLEL